MTHRLLIVVCAAVCGAACSSNTSTPCRYQDETVCLEAVINTEAADAGASLSIPDAGADADADAGAEGGTP